MASGRPPLGERASARIRLRPPFVIMAVVCFALFLGGPLVIAVAVLLLAPAAVSLWVALGCVAFVALLGWAMSSGYQWVEVRRGVIRGKKLLTRAVVERPVGEIVRIMPLHSPLMHPLANAVMDAAMKTSNRGYELRFRDGLRLGLVRGDMA
ncbi:MAG TPA: hypothetical protein VFW33_01570, partial [Gemmataceae bacterium]|nr:hypothetical protein [Gemmataceae bacterium]